MDMCIASQSPGGRHSDDPSRREPENVEASRAEPEKCLQVVIVFDYRLVMGQSSKTNFRYLLYNLPGNASRIGEASNYIA